MDTSKLPKWAQELIADKDQSLREALAFRLTDPVEPDVPVPGFDDLSKGYLFNAYSGDVLKACSSSVFHSYGRDDKTTTQGARRLYSTKALALKALRYSVERDCISRLTRIDKQIEEANKREEQE